MDIIQNYRNIRTLTNRANRQRKNGLIYIILGALLLIGGLPMLFVPFSSPEMSVGLKIGFFIFLLAMVLLYLKLFLHGLKLRKGDPEISRQLEFYKKAISEYDLPTESYDENKTLHTNFVIELPFLTQVTIDGALLKIISDRLTQKNKETVINLKDVSNIKFEDVTLTPGYIAFETPSHSISKADFKTDSNTIPFAGAEVKEYILELKAYTEYLMNNK